MKLVCTASTYPLRKEKGLLIISCLEVININQIGKIIIISGQLVRNTVIRSTHVASHILQTLNTFILIIIVSIIIISTICLSIALSSKIDRC